LTQSCSEGLGSPTTDVFLALNYFFGKNTTGTVSYDRQINQSGDSDLGTVQLQKSLPVGTGYAIWFKDNWENRPQEMANIQYQGAVWPVRVRL